MASRREHPRRIGSPTKRAALAALALLAMGCGLELSGLEPDDGRPDAAPRDAGPDPTDGAPPDAGPAPCPHRGRSEVAAVLDAAALNQGRFDAVVLDGDTLALPSQPYFRGVVMTGYEGQHLDDADPRVSDLDGRAPAFTMMWPTLQRNWETDDAVGLVDDDDDWSARAQGQVFFPAGRHDLRLEGDDRFVFELTLPSGLVRLSATFEGPVEDQILVPEAGWYDFALAMEESTGGARFAVQRRVGEAPFERIGPEALRVDVSAIEGRVMASWDQRSPDGSFPDGIRLDPTGTDADYAGSFPAVAGVENPNDWSVRWVGMHRFDAPAGVLAADVEREMVAFVDGAFVFGDARTGEALLSLGGGAHEVLFELQQDGGADGRAALTYDRAAFAPGQLRPRARGGELLFSGARVLDAQVRASGTTTESVSLEAPEVQPLYVEVSARLADVHEPGAITLRWRDPRGGTLETSLLDSAHRAVDSARFVHRAVLSVGGEPAGSYDLTVVSAEGTPVRLEGLGVLSHLGGDPTPYPAEGTWVSAPIALDAPRAIDRVSLDAHVPSGGAIVRAVRVADRMEDLAAAPIVRTSARGWLDEPLVGRFVQVELRLSGDRVSSPRVWGVRVHGRACVACAAPSGQRCGPWQREGLQAFYPFEEPQPGAWLDRAAWASPANLQITRASSQRAEARGVHWLGDSVARSEEGTADRIIEAIAASGELTFEAWLVPASREPLQGDAQAVLSLARASGDRLVALELGPQATVRAALRGEAGEVTLSSDPGAFERGELLHLVLTRRPGDVSLYVNGASLATTTDAGDPAAWAAGYDVLVGNRPDGGGHLLGMMRLAAIYDAALTPETIAEHYAVGPEGGR